MDSLHGQPRFYPVVESTFLAAASFTDTVPQIGTHLVYECLLVGDTAATSIALQIAMNGDLTTGNYHNQRLGGNNAATIVTEATTYDCATIAAAQAVAAY